MPIYTAASSPLTSDLEALRTSLASISHLQTWLGITTGTDEEKIAAAKLRIFIEGLPHPEGNSESRSLEEWEQLLPLVLLWLDRFDDLADAVGGDGWEYGQSSGQISCEFYQLLQADEPEPGETNQLFLNQIGTILRSNDANDPGLCELSGTDTHFTFNRYSTTGAHRSTDDVEEQANPTQGPPTIALRAVFEWGGR